MDLFVTGGSGLTGPAVVSQLIAAGHTVTGPARSDDAAGRLAALGATTHRGSLEDLDSVREGARTAEGVVHMAFGGSFADPEDLIRQAVCQHLGHARHARRPRQHRTGPAGSRAARRLPHTGRAGLPRLRQSGRPIQRRAARADGARPRGLRVHPGPDRGSALHGAGESAITFRSIAEHITRTLEIPVASLAMEQAAAHASAPTHQRRHK